MDYPQAQSFSLQKYAHLLHRQRRSIGAFALAGLVLGVGYVLFFFQPTYESQGKILIKDYKTPNFVTEFQTDNGIKPLTLQGNPILTEMEILTSDQIAATTWHRLVDRFHLSEAPRVGQKMVKAAVTIKNPPGTDVIDVTAQWSDPKVAREIAQSYMDYYTLFNLELKRKHLVRQQEYLDTQIDRTRNQLTAVRQKMRDFQQRSGLVDTITENDVMSQQIAALQTALEGVNGDLLASARKATALQGRLGMPVDTAVQAAAVGQNPEFLTLQESLKAAQQEHASLSAKYTDANPKVIQAKARMERAQEHLQEILQRSGGAQNSGFKSGFKTLADPVRAGILSTLVDSEATAQSLQAKSATLQGLLSQLVALKATLPEKQFALNSLKQQETVLSDVLNTLEAKQVEVRLQESEIVSNANVVDTPELPAGASFPKAWHLLLMFPVLGGLLGVGRALLFHFLQDHVDDSHEVEAVLNAPVLGGIPWLEQKAFEQSLSGYEFGSQAVEKVLTELAYQKIAVSMRIRDYVEHDHTHGGQVLAFTSTEFSKQGSRILKQVAMVLSRLGQSVLVVEADFKNPTVYQEFLPQGKTLDAEPWEDVYHADTNSHWDWEMLQRRIFQLSGHGEERLHVLPSPDQPGDMATAFLGRDFAHFLQQARQRYHWVFLDAPPVLAVPDVVMLSRHLDGVVLMTGLRTTRNTLRAVKKLLGDHHLPVFGVMMREVVSEAQLTANPYVLQLAQQDAYMDDALTSPVGL